MKHALAEFDGKDGGENMSKQYSRDYLENIELSGEQCGGEIRAVQDFGEKNESEGGEKQFSDFGVRIRVTVFFYKKGRKTKAYKNETGNPFEDVEVNEFRESVTDQGAGGIHESVGEHGGTEDGEAFLTFGGEVGQC